MSAVTDGIAAALDNVACRIVAMLEGEGYRTLAVPASQLVDWDLLTGAVSHIRLARLAGLGYVGRHNLLVTPRFGAAVRLVSVFTDAPLTPDAPVTGECGACRACIKVCPAGAIGETAADWDRVRCVEKIKEFKKENADNISGPLFVAESAPYRPKYNRGTAYHSQDWGSVTAKRESPGSDERRGPQAGAPSALPS